MRVPGWRTFVKGLKLEFNQFGKVVYWPGRVSQAERRSFTALGVSFSVFFLPFFAKGNFFFKIFLNFMFILKKKKKIILMQKIIRGEEKKRIF